MAGFSQPSDVEAKWAELDRGSGSLPDTLRPHQRDTIFNILNGKHVLLCVSTGKSDHNQCDYLVTYNYCRRWENLGSTLLYSTVF